MLIILALLFSIVILVKIFKIWHTGKQMMLAMPAGVTVSAMTVTSQPWQTEIKAVGSLRAVTGVNVTTELQGMIQEIYFKPGSMVEKGTLLVQLNISTELNQLKALEAQRELAKVTYDRDQAQYAIQAVSKQTVDTDLWNLRNLEAQVQEQQSIINKKTVRAPFSGRLGISNVNPGQVLNVGDKVTSLQALNPIYVDFNVPQQDIGEIKIGQTITVTSDAFPKTKFTGKVSTIEPVVDVTTRNIAVEAEISNKEMTLLPGMFVSVEVTTGRPKSFITVPQTAVSFNPYGEVVFVIKEEAKKEKDNKDKDKTTDTKKLIAKQVFVTTGDTKGDQIQVLSGLKEGDKIVTSGQLKLKNDAPVIIDNKVVPLNQANPKVSNYS